MVFKALKLNPKDNVATAMEPIEKGGEVQVSFGTETQTIYTVEEIPFGFKIAVQEIQKTTPIFKYGEIIGIASKDIHIGEIAHIHNVEGARGRGDIEGGKK